MFSATGTDTLPIELEQDADVTGFDFGERGREPSRITVVDLFASSRENDSVLVAANSSNNGHWYAIERGWPGTESLNIDLNEDMSNAQLDLTTTEAQQYFTTLDLSSGGQARRLGSDGQGHLWQIFASRDQLFDGTDAGPGDTDDGCSENGSGCSTTGSAAEGEPAAGMTVVTGAAEGEAPLPVGTPELGTRLVTEPASGLPRPPLTAPNSHPQIQPPEGENPGAQEPASSMPANPYSATDSLMAEPDDLFFPVRVADQVAPFTVAGGSTSDDNDSFETAIDLLMGEPHESDVLAN